MGYKGIDDEVIKEVLVFLKDIGMVFLYIYKE